MNKILRSNFAEAIKKDAEITIQMTIRDVRSKYKGSRLGMIWSILNPIIMLVIYTLVFSQIFQAKWGNAISDGNNTIVYALNLFAGLSVFNIFSEVIARSPTLITSNPNYVKKIRFPLHVLGEMTTISL